MKFTNVALSHVAFGLGLVVSCALVGCSSDVSPPEENAAAAHQSLVAKVRTSRNFRGMMSTAQSITPLMNQALPAAFSGSLAGRMKASTSDEERSLVLQQAFGDEVENIASVVKENRAYGDRLGAEVPELASLLPGEKKAVLREAAQASLAGAVHLSDMGPTPCGACVDGANAIYLVEAFGCGLLIETVFGAIGCWATATVTHHIAIRACNLQYQGVGCPVSQKPGELGAPCTEDANCVVSLACSGKLDRKTCQDPNFTFAPPDPGPGTLCSSDLDCAPGARCDQNSCVP